MSPVGLGELLATLPHNTSSDLLVGYETNDDAAIYRIDGETAVILTADIITPPVDDPHLFGQIAAANALSDVYAMGGRPVTCLNLAGFPADKLKPQVLQDIVAGALGKITEAGAVLGGGHTTQDDEPKFGLSVMGLVHPERYWSNATARPGDALVLTKPIGSGVLFNANRKGQVSPEAMAECLDVLTTLNKTSSEVCRRFTVHAATDVTGFGLAGHALEMAQGSGVTLTIEVDAVPLLPEALAMYKRGVTTGVNNVNRELVESVTRFEKSLPRWHEEVLFDPQTSGGLLLAVEAREEESLVDALQAGDAPRARRIGTVGELEAGCHLVFR